MRRAITIALCSVTFFLIAFVIPVQATDRLTSIKYVCSSWNDAMETVRLQVAEEMDDLIALALSDADFKCWFLDRVTPFQVIELVYEYTAYGVAKGVTTVRLRDGTVVYTFGTMKFINQILHQEGA